MGASSAGRSFPCIIQEYGADGRLVGETDPLKLTASSGRREGRECSP
jgi:hypothetical protein